MSLPEYSLFRGGGRRVGTDTLVDVVEGGPLDWLTQGLFPENCLRGVDHPLEEPTARIHLYHA